MNRRLWVLIAIILLAGTSALKGGGPDGEWIGVLWTKGGVSVGEARVSGGTTVMPGDVISTSEGASAWIRFQAPASTTMLANTQVVMLDVDSAPSFVLRQGTVVVDEKVVDPLQVTVPGGFVLMQGDPQTGAVCELAAVGNASTISVKRGLAELHSLGLPVLLHAGQSARLEAGQQQGGPPVAGRINKEIPQGTITRNGELQTLPLKLNQVVDWNDLVQTQKTGRAQIMLLDGSILNVGARSTIKILKHDPQAQQTNIELTLGKVQANVQKITAPGGKFELHTKSAVIGTIDTSFVAEADDKRTRVCGIKGTTVVKSSDPKNTKEVRLHRNECTVVIFGGVPTDPVYAPGEVANLLNQAVIQNMGGIAGVSTGTAVAIGGAAAAAGVATGIVLSGGGTTSPTTP
jgi:ferric-dicitrate binding protein FerR (iron transport regulator)